MAMLNHVKWVMARILATCTVIIFFTACDPDDGPATRDIIFFKTRLHTDMRHDAILKIFGVANADLGSGIHIYQYNLDDRTMVLIGCTDKIMYANHVDQQQKLLGVLI